MNKANNLVYDYASRNASSSLIKTLFALVLCAVFVFARPHQAIAQLSPKAIAEDEIIDLERACKQGGHDFTISYNPIIEIDLGGTSDREVIFDQHALECKGDSLLLYGGGGPHTDIISTEGQVGYMSWDRPSIVWLDAHWAVRFEMDPSVETEECASYCFRYVFMSEGKFVERYKSEK